MTGGRPRSWVLPCCIAASIALHLAAASLVLSGHAARSLEARIGHQPPPDEAEATLGVERSDAVTITWIGFEQPTPHSAVRATVDQAQVNPAASPTVQAAVEAASSAIADAGRETAAVIDDAVSRLRAFAHGVDLAAERAREAREVAEAAERAGAASQARQVAADAANASEGEAAIPDDREATASANEPTLSYQMGQPVARQGLRIRTVIPQFDATTRLTDLRSLRRKPVVEVTFGRDGSVIRAAFVQGTASGRTSVDEPILNAVFRWRATGSDLAAVPPDEPTKGLTVQIRFDF
ncbi:MAG: hypothetical protein ACTS22_05590 [Phycisphaerales bacterium]